MENKDTSEKAEWGCHPFGVSMWGGLGACADLLLQKITRSATVDLFRRAAQLVEDELVSVLPLQQLARQLLMKNGMAELGLWEEGTPWVWGMRGHGVVSG